MLDSLRKLWREAVWEVLKAHLKAILTICIALLIAIFSLLFYWLRQYLSEVVEVPVKVLILVGFSPLALLLVVFGAIFLIRRRRRTPAPYCRDLMKGIIWQWALVPRRTGWAAVNLIALCPKCEAELNFVPRSTIERKRVALVCPRGCFSCEARGDKSSISQLAVNEIERRFRTGEYAKARARIRAHKKELHS